MHRKGELLCGYTSLLRHRAFIEMEEVFFVPLRWACFPIKIGQNAQWEHLFILFIPMIFRPLTLFFSLKVYFRR